MSNTSTKAYWEGRYLSGGNSGAGSYRHMALYKAGFLNRFVARNNIATVAELGCGDGEQLRRAIYPSYTGYDIAQAAVDLCGTKFAGDATKSFHCLSDLKTLAPAELSMSLDVVYHLLEDGIFEEHIQSLFRIATRYAIIYGNGCVKPYPAKHVILRDFQDVIRRRQPRWTLVNAERNPFYSETGTDPNATWSNFYVYEAPRAAWHPVLRGPIPLAAPREAATLAATQEPELAELLPLASKATRLVSVEPPDAALLTSLLRACPDLNATVVSGDHAASMEAWDDAIFAFGERLALAPASTLAVWLTPERNGADLVHLSPAALRALTTADLRALVRTGSARTIVVAEPVDAPARAALSKAIGGGYLREILPDMRGAGPNANRNLWVGSLLVQPTLIVSLTSIRSRLGYLETVVGSILKQSRIPDRVILHLSDKPYLQDEGVPRDAVPEGLLALERAGVLEIRHVENTGPYRKLLPVLRAEWGSNCVIVTADDDTIYPEHWLDELYSAYLARPSIISIRQWTVRIENGSPMPYQEWSKSTANPEVRPEYTNLFLFPTGKDGVLYHPSFFTEDVFDPELIRLAPTTDDLAFKLATLLTETPVFGLPRRQSTSGAFAEFPPVESGVRVLRLHNGRGPNDDSLRKLLDYWGERDILHLSRFLHEPAAPPDQTVPPG